MIVRQHGNTQIPEACGIRCTAFLACYHSRDQIEIGPMYLQLGEAWHRFHVEAGLLFWREGEQPNPEDDLKDGFAYADLGSQLNVLGVPVSLISFQDAELRIVFNNGAEVALRGDNAYGVTTTSTLYLIEGDLWKVGPDGLTWPQPSLTLQELHGALWGVKFLLAILGAAPIIHWPANQAINEANSKIATLFHSTADTVLTLTPMSPEWLAHSKEFVRENISCSELYDEEGLDAYLSLYSGVRALQSFPYKDKERLGERLVPVLRSLVQHLAFYLLHQGRKDNATENPLWKFESCVSEWLLLGPELEVTDAALFLRDIVEALPEHQVEQDWLAEYLVPN